MNYQDHTTAITARLIDMIHTGSHDQWAMPWHTHDLGDLLNARNTTTGKPYAGSNTFSLALDALDRGFPTGEWSTYRQWSEYGAQVRKGERSAQIVKWVTTKSNDADQPATSSDGKHQEARRLVPRVYAVVAVRENPAYASTLFALTTGRTQDQATKPLLWPSHASPVGSEQVCRIPGK